MKYPLYTIFLIIIASLVSIPIFVFLPLPIQKLFPQLENIILLNPLRGVIGVIIIVSMFTRYVLTMKYHELAHWCEAAKYHTLTNPRIAKDSHFECDNWKDFTGEKENICKIAQAGIKFDIKNNITELLLSLFELWIIPFVIIFMIGSAIPVKFSDTFATDGYWSIHTEEFIESKL